MDTVAIAGWETRAAALTAELVAAGVLPDPEWSRAFREVPRHVFVPRILGDDRTPVQVDEAGWLDLVYADETLLTQTIAAGDGLGRHEMPSSSSSRPRVMATMLDRLNVQHGQKVLEIGTGTGYNTALLSHHLGAENVYSVDIDPSLVDGARDHLARLGQHPQLAAADGADGWAKHAPFNRILATCAVTCIPPAWIDQLTGAGRIVAPLDAGEAGPLLVMDKTAPDEVTGRIDPYPAHFMPLRDRADDPLGQGQTTGFTGTGVPHYGTTGLDPALLTEGGTDLALFLWLHAPGLRIARADELGRLYVNTAAALAEVELAAGEDGTWLVKQRGAFRLWDIVEHGYATWTALDRPGPGRLGITALNSVDGQFAWLDDPDGAHSWPLAPTG
ncbi:MAG: methyltransferase domain-containing protein [Pseudonocardiaceae bacterium]|nr:methyltransferase domain-containing protein [Pseudonocardiaceae bacterium]